MSENSFIRPLTAAGGNSRAARSARAKLQWRDRFGRWVEMGRGVKFKVRFGDGAVRSVIGKYVGAKDAETGQVYVSGDPNSLPDGFYSVKSSNAQEMVADLSPEQLKSRGISLGMNAEGAPVGERMSEEIPTVDQIERADAPAGWTKLPDTFGGKNVIETEDGDFRIHFGGKDTKWAVEDVRGNPGRATSYTDAGDAFKQVSDLDVSREESGDEGYTGLAANNDERLAELSATTTRDDIISRIKRQEGIAANPRTSPAAVARADTAIAAAEKELADGGMDPYDPSGSDSDEALAARKAAAPAPAAPAGPDQTAINTEAFGVKPEGFLVPTGKVTNDITPQGLADHITAEMDHYSEGGKRIVIDTDAGTAEGYNSADTVDNAKAQAGGVGSDHILDLATGKVEPVEPPANVDPSGDNTPATPTTEEAPDAEVRSPDAEQSPGAEPGAVAPDDNSVGEPAEPVPAPDTAAPAPALDGDRGETPDSERARLEQQRTGAQRVLDTSGNERALERAAARLDEIDARLAELEAGESAAPEADTPATEPGSVEELQARRNQLQAALENSGDPKDMIALNSQIDALDNRIEADRPAPPVTAPTPEAVPDTAAPDSEPVATTTAPREAPEHTDYEEPNADKAKAARDKLDNIEAKIKAELEGQDLEDDPAEIEASNERIAKLERQHATQTAALDKALGNAPMDFGRGKWSPNKAEDRGELPRAEPAPEPDATPDPEPTPEPEATEAPSTPYEEPGDADAARAAREEIAAIDSDIAAHEKALETETDPQVRAEHESRIGTLERQKRIQDNALNRALGNAPMDFNGDLGWNMRDRDNRGALPEVPEATPEPVDEPEAPETPMALDEAVTAPIPDADEDFYAELGLGPTPEALRPARNKPLSDLTDEELETARQFLFTNFDDALQGLLSSKIDEIPEEVARRRRASDDQAYSLTGSKNDGDLAPGDYVIHSDTGNLIKLTGPNADPEYPEDIGFAFESRNEQEAAENGISDVWFPDGLRQTETFEGWGDSEVVPEAAAIPEPEPEPEPTPDVPEAPAATPSTPEERAREWALTHNLPNSPSATLDEVERMLHADLDTFLHGDGAGVNLDDTEAGILAIENERAERARLLNVLDEMNPATPTPEPEPEPERRIPGLPADAPVDERTRLERERANAQRVLDTSGNERALERAANRIDEIDARLAEMDAEATPEPVAAPAPEVEETTPEVVDWSPSGFPAEERVVVPAPTPTGPVAPAFEYELEPVPEYNVGDILTDAEGKKWQVVAVNPTRRDAKILDKDRNTRTIQADDRSYTLTTPAAEAPPIPLKPKAERKRRARQENEDKYNEENPTTPAEESLRDILEAELAGKDLDDEAALQLNDMLDDPGTSLDELQDLRDELESLPNAANTETKPRKPEGTPPPRIPTSITDEQDDPFYEAPFDIMWQGILDAHPDAVVTPEGDLMVGRIENPLKTDKKKTPTNKDYELRIRRTDRHTAFVYIMETDRKTGERKALRLSPETHSWDTFSGRLERAHEEFVSPRLYVKVSRSYDTEHLGTNRQVGENPLREFLERGVRPDGPDQVFNDVANVVIDRILSGEKFGKVVDNLRKMQEVDTDAVDRVAQAFIAQMMAPNATGFKPRAVHTSYDGRTVEAGMRFEWTDHRKMLGWGTEDFRPNPDYRKVYRGTVIGLRDEHSDGKGRRYGDDLVIQFDAGQKKNTNHGSLAAQAIRILDDDSEPLGLPFEAKREELGSPEAVANAFGVPVAARTAAAPTKPRPRAEAQPKPRRPLTINPATNNVAGFPGVRVPHDKLEAAALLETGDRTNLPAREMAPGDLFVTLNGQGEQTVNTVLRTRPLEGGQMKVTAGSSDNGVFTVQEITAGPEEYIAVKPTWAPKAPEDIVPGAAVTANGRTGIITAVEGDSVSFKDDEGLIDVANIRIVDIDPSVELVEERKELMDQLDRVVVSARTAEFYRNIITDLNSDKEALDKVAFDLSSIPPVGEVVTAEHRGFLQGLTGLAPRALDRWMDKLRVPVGNDVTWRRSDIAPLPSDLGEAEAVLNDPLAFTSGSVQSWADVKAGDAVMMTDEQGYNMVATVVGISSAHGGYYADLRVDAQHQNFRQGFYVQGAVYTNWLSDRYTSPQGGDYKAFLASNDYNMDRVTETTTPISDSQRAVIESLQADYRDIAKDIRGGFTVVAVPSGGNVHDIGQIVQTRNGGESFFMKRYEEEGDSTRSMHQEYLSIAVARALEIKGVKATYLEEDNMFVMNAIDGEIADLVPDRVFTDITMNIFNYDNAWRMGLLDMLIHNEDRHSGNWMVGTDGQPYPIDHGHAYFNDSFSPSNPFASRLREQIALGNAEVLTPATLLRLRNNLEALGSVFASFGRTRWYDTMMRSFEDVVEDVHEGIITRAGI